MKKRYKLIFPVFVVLGIVVIFELWYSYDHLVVNTYEYSSGRIDEDINIVVIADLHDHEFSPANTRLADLVHAQNPDLILMAGDFLNSDSQDAHVPLEFLESLGGDVPVYFSLGNHEIDYMNAGHPQLIQQLEDAGITVLEKEYEDIQINGSSLRIGGMYEKDKMDIFITSGLGSHTQLLPRFNNPPEIAVINIKQKE